MTYRVVFDIVERGYDPTPALFGLPFLFVGALQWFSARRGIPEAVRLNATVPARWSPGPLFSIALVAVGLLLTVTYWDYVHDCAALAAGQARVVEGPVVHLDYGAGRSPHRRFEVAGVPFHFKPSMLESSSRESGLRETLLRDGLAVRIHALDGEIVRLEVASEAASISRPEGPRAALLLFLFVGLGMFRGFQAVSSRISGWHSAERRFAARMLQGEEAFSGQAVSLLREPWTYRHRANVCVGPDVVSLVLTLPSGAFHRPLAIPMAAITSCERDATSTTLTIAGERMKIRLSGESGLALLAARIAFTSPVDG